MPQYERECENCGFFREAEQEKMSSPKSVPCPKCGEEKLSRVISLVNFKMTGSSAKNGYTSDLTNEQLGMPSERDLLKRLESEYAVEQMQYNRNLTDREKEFVKGNRDREKDKKSKEEKRINKLKNKHKEFTKSLEKGFKTAKEKTEFMRKISRNKREAEGELGTKKAPKSMKVNINDN